MKPIDIATSPAKPRVRPIPGHVSGYQVRYRGIEVELVGIYDGDKICRWVVRDGDERVADGWEAETALGAWRRELDDEAEIMRAMNRKPGRPVEYPDAHSNVSATVVANRSIRLHGDCHGRPVDRTYRIGQRAEYGSYNLHYFGRIVSITAKTVTIDPCDGTRRRRLTIDAFALRNWDDPARKDAMNADTLRHI